MELFRVLDPRLFQSRRLQSVPETGLEEIKVLKDENFQKLASEGLVWNIIAFWRLDYSKTDDFSWRQGLVWKKFRF